MTRCTSARQRKLKSFHGHRSRPAHRPPQRPAEGPRTRARRQIDFASRADSRRACSRRDPHLRPARRRGCAQYRKGRAGARRACRKGGRWRMACSWRRRRRLCRTCRRARFRQFGNRMPAHARRGRRLPDRGDVRRRRLAPQAADAARARAAGTHRRAHADSKRRPPAADARWGARSDSHRVRAASRRRRS